MLGGWMFLKPDISEVVFDLFWPFPGFFLRRPKCAPWMNLELFVSTCSTKGKGTHFDFRANGLDEPNTWSVSSAMFLFKIPLINNQ